MLLEATGMNIFHGGGGVWTDVVSVTGADGADPGSGWSFELITGTVDSQGDGRVECAHLENLRSLNIGVGQAGET